MYSNLNNRFCLSLSLILEQDAMKSNVDNW